MKDFIEIISNFFSEYFSYSINALAIKGIWFKPAEIETGENKKKLSLHPKQIIFTIFNLLIGVSIVSTIKEIDFSDIAPFIVMAIVLWLFWSCLGYFISLALQLKNLTFLNSLALSLQTYGVIYVLASLITVLVKTIATFIDLEISAVFFIIQFALLIIYLPIAYLKYYTYKYKVQPILSGLLCSISYVYFNYSIVTNSDSLATYGTQPKENILILDASSIPKRSNAKVLIDQKDYKSVDVILVAADSLIEIDTRDGNKKVDSMLTLINHSNKPVVADAFKGMTGIAGGGVSFLHIYSNFDWLKSDSSFLVSCDTLVAHLIFSDSVNTEKLTTFKTYLDSLFKKKDYLYQDLMLIPKQVPVNKKLVRKQRSK